MSYELWAMGFFLYPSFFFGLLAEAFKGINRRLLPFPGLIPNQYFPFLRLEALIFHFDPQWN
jgi:hypothetical protein